MNVVTWDFQNGWVDFHDFKQKSNQPANGKFTYATNYSLDLTPVKSRHKNHTSDVTF